MSEKNIENIITKVFDSFQKLTPALIAIAVGSGIVLFAPNGFLSKLGLHSLPNSAKATLGIVFLLSCVLILCIILFSCAKFFRKQKVVFDLKRECRSLSPQQKNILKRMLSSNEKSCMMKSTDGDIVLLTSKGFISRPNQIADQGMIVRNIYTYCPQPWVIELWLKNPKLFD